MIRRLKKLKVGQAGLTFAELIVVIAIFSIMAGIIIFNSQGFNNSIALQNLSQDIALQLKRAQTEGSGGKANQCSFLQKPAYGIFFNKNKNQFTYFADLNNNKYYDTTSICVAGSESQEVFSIGNGNTISKICVNQKTGLGNCSTTITDLQVTFTRPDLSATIVSGTYLSTILDAEIELLSASGQKKQIVIWPTGQISIE